MSDPNVSFMIKFILFITFMRFYMMHIDSNMVLINVIEKNIMDCDLD